MADPLKSLRAAEVDGLERGEALYEWAEGRAGLVADRVTYHGTPGAILAYTNPPVHQVGNPGLDAYLGSLDAITTIADELRFVLFTGPADPAHAGGDIRESLTRLDDTHVKRDELQSLGASDEAIWALYDWGDARLDKGFALYEAIRGLSEKMTTVAVCSGGTRFGGSAEACLLADVLVGDSRSGMSFSEVQIGLIPGWGGVGRAITKAGFGFTASMAYTADIARADKLLAAGIYDVVVDVPHPLPRMGRTGDKAADKANYLAALASNDADTAPLMLKAALDAGVAPPARDGAAQLAPAVDREGIHRRANPDTYEAIWGEKIKDVKDRIRELGKPLAPQSVEALDELFERFEGQEWDERAFILAEKDADATLYRDPRFRAGIVATLEQRVADFRRP
jgi:enoyl-CoA hydratase/carnithine racemase